MRAIFIIPTKPSPRVENILKFSGAFNAFIARCLTKDPAKRPSAAELQTDPFIVNAPSNIVLTDKASRSSELIYQGALQTKEPDL